MAQVIPNLGILSGASTGLGAGLQELAGRKIKELHQREKQGRLAGLLQKQGYSPDQSELISSLPENSILSALQSLPPSGQIQQQPSFAQMEQQEQVAPQLQQALSQLKSQTPQVSGLELLKQAGTQKLGEIGLAQKETQAPGKFTPLNAQELFEQARLSGITLTPEQQQKLNNKVSQINASEELQRKFQPLLEQIKSQKSAPNRQEAATEALVPQPLFKKPLSEAEKIAKERLELKKQELTSKEQALANKETKPVYDEIIKTAKNAKENDMRLDRMEQLIEKGNLGSPVRNTIIRTVTKGILGYGLDLTSFMTADAQEFDKLSQDFIKGAKEVFPGRVTDADLNAYMKTVPNLMQSAAGMKRLINSMRSWNEAAKIKEKALRDIIKENNGKRPIDIDVQIEERTRPALDKLAKKFVEAPFIGETGLGSGIIRY